jgi:glycosyltransferase involved in cell wall biosynthesis
MAHPPSASTSATATATANTSAPVVVAFLNENTLGHTSYLPRFARELERRPELGIVPRLIDVTPLPAALQRRADFSIRGLRKFGLDLQAARWRRIASAHARNQVDALRAREPVAALVVNTQSVALDLTPLATTLPTLVCLDATFAQLSRTPWFRLNRIAGWFLPLTLAPIRSRERRILAAARRLLVWSSPVRDSLLTEYGTASDRVAVLPPSLDLANLPTHNPNRPPNPRPRLLFLGGDFRRKGGPSLLETFRRRFAQTAELHIVTESDVPPEPGVFVHRNIRAGSPEWLDQWARADLFVFPSRLETFGIVLIEAMAFGVPLITTPAGAATDLTENGLNGALLPDASPQTLGDTIARVLADPAAAQQRANRARTRVERDFDLHRNTARLADLIRDSLS